MNYWFVCQGDSFTPDTGMKYLWAPLKDKSGNQQKHWETVKRVKKGDVIFNYSNGIRGISIANSNAYPSNSGSTYESRWNEAGTRVDIDFYPFDRIISSSDLLIKRETLRTSLENIFGPFDKDGGAKQGYLFEFSPYAGKVIRDIYGKVFPEAVDVYFKDVLLQEKNKLLVRKDHIALKTKPFIILAGLSGTGKSRLVRTLAYEFYNIPKEKSERKDPPVNFQLIKVKPNWHDSSDLLGYESRISGKDRYIVTDFVKFLVGALRYPETPFFLCLDEMNLAPVEQYFAEYLSVLETRELRDGTVSTDVLINASVFDKYANRKEGVDENFDLWRELDLTDEIIRKYLLGKGLTLPSNLIVMGTVNMDETTHSFSRKVLDRAMTIEMNQINLKEHLGERANTWKYPDEPFNADLVLSDKTHGWQVYEDLGPDADTIIGYLEEVNDKLKDTPFLIAYRVRDEFLLYAYNYSKYANKPEDWLNEVLDEMTRMKILPRIEGDEEKTAVLGELIKLFTKRKLNSSLAKAKEMEKQRSKYHCTSFWS